MTDSPGNNGGGVAMRIVRVRKKAWVALAVCVTAAWYIVSWLTNDLVCSPTESQQLLDQLCEDYHAGLIDGSLCPDICDKKTITFKKCANYQDGKKIFIVKHHRDTIVLKSKKPRWTDFDPIEVSGIFPSMKDFMKMVAGSVEFNLGIHRDEFPKFSGDDVTLLSSVWSVEGAKHLLGGTVKPETTRRDAMMRSVWTLLQQTEYLLLAFLYDKPHIPTLLGTCGHFYAMEYLPPGPALESTVLEMTGLKKEVPWRDRLKVTLSLLEALKSYDEELHQTLHLCDVKGENFGVNKKGTVKLLDLDTVFFSSRLRGELGSDVCGRHADCNFFDCEGWCNKTVGKCTPHRINNNLQVICTKLLSSQLSNKYLSLLRGAPYEIEEPLEALVTECIMGRAVADHRAGSVTVDQLTQHHAPVRLLDRIYNLLQKDLINHNHS